MSAPGASEKLSSVKIVYEMSVQLFPNEELHAKGMPFTLLQF